MLVGASVFSIGGLSWAMVAMGAAGVEETAGPPHPLRVSARHKMITTKKPQVFGYTAHSLIDVGLYHLMEELKFEFHEIFCHSDVREYLTGMFKVFFIIQPVNGAVMNEYQALYPCIGGHLCHC